jgi:hypothetical protein
MLTKGLLPTLWFNFVITFLIFPALMEATTLAFLNGNPSEGSYFILTMNFMYNGFVFLGTFVGGILIL